MKSKGLVIVIVVVTGYSPIPYDFPPEGGEHFPGYSYRVFSDTI